MTGIGGGDGGARPSSRVSRPALPAGLTGGCEALSGGSSRIRGGPVRSQTF